MNKSQEKDETQSAKQTGWLRAGVLGANDGVLSTSSLIVGVAAAHSSSTNIVLAGVAGLVAGAMSMAAGEYVSVSSQSDADKADIARERKELATEPNAEHEELAQIYVERGLDPALAKQVASQLMAYDALGAHARDELGISARTTARPLQAAMVSAIMFSIGAAFPLLILLISPSSKLIFLVSSGSLVFLAALGGFAARMGGANALRGAVRVTLWGAIAMAITFIVGLFFGAPSL